MTPKTRYSASAVTGLAVIYLAAIIGGNLACLADADGAIVAYYSFEEEPGNVVRDWSGMGNNGKIHDAKYVKLADGKGYALRFDTDEAYVDCGNNASLNITDAITIELWLYPETRPISGEAGLVGKKLGSYGLAYSGNCWWYVHGGCSAPASTGAWHHIAATFDGSEMKLYSDGELAGSRPSSQPKMTSGENFYLRYPVFYGDKVAPTFKCVMDEVVVYDRALSDEEILRHYQQEVEARAKDLTWFEQVQAIPCGEQDARHTTTVWYQPALARYVVPPTLLVVVDYSGLRPILSGSSLTAELLYSSESRRLRQRRTTLLPSSGIVDVRFDTADFPGGTYQIHTVATDPKGAQIGGTSLVKVNLPPDKPTWLEPDQGGEILNNLVVQLLSIQAPQSESHQRYKFTNPRDGWIFVSSSASVQEAGRIVLAIDGGSQDEPLMVHLDGDDEVQEAMRHLPSGEHTLTVHCEGGASLQSLIVRAIPEIMYPGIGYKPSPFLAGYPRYLWDYLVGIGMPENVNVVLEREPEPSMDAEEWRKQGKKIVTRSTTHEVAALEKPVTADKIYELLSNAPGFAHADRDGVMFDELDSSSHDENYPAYIEAVQRLAQTPEFAGKVFYPYCAPMYNGELSTAFLRQVIEVGYKFGEEKYLSEQPTEAEAWKILEYYLVENTERYQAVIPDCQKHMIVCLGYMTAPPETLNVNPGVDWKVFQDMAFNLIANHPVLWGLYGIQCYHSAYADEEVQRWTAKLLRHYCIEGNRQMLSTDPYILPHIQNPDFAEGTAGWRLSPAEEGSMEVRSAEGYSWLQGRYPPTTQGNTFLWTKRSAQRPNRFSQQIKKLEPGRLYSLKMFTADYQCLVQQQDVKESHQVRVQIDDVELIRDKSFQEIYPSGLAGHSHGEFNRENNLWIDYHLLVFRARSENATLTVSDWASDTQPGGPLGQELIYNFIEVQPYLED